MDQLKSLFKQAKIWLSEKWHRLQARWWAWRDQPWDDEFGRFDQVFPARSLYRAVYRNDRV